MRQLITSWKNYLLGNFGAIELPIHVYTYSLMYYNFFEIFEIGKKGRFGYYQLIQMHMPKINRLSCIYSEIFTFYVHKPLYNIFFVPYATAVHILVLLC